MQNVSSIQCKEVSYYVKLSMDKEEALSCHLKSMSFPSDRKN